jgi:uncharacterized protein YegL
MEQEDLYILRKHSKGFAALTIVLLAAALSILSYIVIQYGRISLNIVEEKQSLDSCSVGVGRSIISTNDIESICSSNFLNSCSGLLNMPMPNMSCVDEGLECDGVGICERVFTISSTYNPGHGEVSKDVVVKVKEEEHDVSIVDAAVIMLLDFSGSMNGNRITQLKDTVRSFIDSDYNLSYSVILYNSDIITTSNIGKGQQHNQSIHTMINSNNPGGGTNFVKPLNEALNQIQTSNYEVYYILLISDGSPNEGIDSSQNFVQNNVLSLNNDACLFTTSQNPCITVYTLGVDNANQSALQSISGNTLSQNPEEYSYTVNANQVQLAFQAIIEEIMCRIGPVLAELPINVFNGLDLLDENIDYVYNEDTKVFKFYDVDPFYICTEMLNDSAQLTLRWGGVNLNVSE